LFQVFTDNKRGSSAVSDAVGKEASLQMKIYRSMFLNTAKTDNQLKLPFSK